MTCFVEHDVKRNKICYDAKELRDTMEIETLKRSHLKRNIMIGVAAVLIISAIVLNFTRAKYRVTDSIPLIHSIINYSPGDIIITAYLDNVQLETLPEKGTVSLENITCDNNATASFDTSNWQINVSNLTQKGTKCDVYFKEGVPAKDTILAGKDIDDSRSGAITGILTTNTTGTVYSVADDWGTSYVFAGAPTDNWVRFAGFYWRIIRINGDGSIRLIYNGTGTATTGTSTQIGTSAYNSSYNDNAYVGYMYGSTGASSYASTHANTKNSTIKGVLDNWYKTNIADKGYSDKVSTEAGFCNDRQTMSGVHSSYGTTGYGTNLTSYAPWGRLYQNRSWKSSQTPSLKCSQIANDMFTVSGSSKGNHKLTYPVGLITSDEVVLAGGFGNSNNTSYYLYTAQNYWTMSPSSFYTLGDATVFAVNSNGNLGYSIVSNTYGVRPVINLKADVSITGSGTSGNPYVVS